MDITDNINTRYTIQIKLIALCRSADVVLDDHALGIVLSEVLDHTASTAYNVELHKVGIVFVLSELAENTFYILCRRRFDDLQILLGNIRRSVPKYTLDYGIVGDNFVRPSLQPTKQSHAETSVPSAKNPLLLV